MKGENITITVAEKKDSQNCIKLNHNNRNRKKKGEGTNGSRGQTRIKGAERDGEGVYC